MSDLSHTISKVFAASAGFIEKAVEIRYFMLLTSCVLLLDSCLVLFYGKEFHKALSSIYSPEISVSNLLIFLCIYTFSMSLLFPVTRRILKFVVDNIYFKWIYDWNKHSEFVKDWHYPTLKRTEAMLNKDKFTLDLIREHYASISNAEINYNAGFSLFCLFVLNYLVLGAEDVNTITQLASKLLDVDYGFLINRFVSINFAVFLIFLVYMFGISLDPREEGKVYIPSNPKRKCNQSLNTDSRNNPAAG